MQKPILPKGISDFGKLVRHINKENQRFIFVDKTLLIKDFLNAGDEITLITRPRRFGKTINLSMLEHFFNKEIDGTPTKGLFDGLKISQYPNIMADQGQIPTIFITLNEIRGKDFEEAYGLIKDEIKILYKKHKYLLESDKLLDNDKQFFHAYLNKTADLTDYKSSLKFLSNLIKDHTGKKVYILLDEYDTPLNDAYVNGYYEDMQRFMSSFFGKAFKGNANLEKGLITGILKIAKSSLFSELNNVTEYTCLNSSLYSEYFGFTEEETNDLLDRVGLPAKAQELKQMYNGYNINGITLYNPFSIVNFASESIALNNPKAALRSYWVNSGGHGIFMKILSSNIINLEEDLTKLFNNQPITTIIDENIIMGDYLKGNNVSFWSLMLLAGYLKPIAKIKPKDQLDDYIYELLFPNSEVRVSFKKLVLEVLSSGPTNSYSYNNAMQLLSIGKINEFEKFIKEYMRQGPSYYDVSQDNQEKFYHGMILGMSACLYNSHIITSNRESGEGRYDICLEPKDTKEKGVIIELKCGKENDNLSMLAQKAYDQIQSKDYKRDMESKGIKEIIPLGISFYGKDVEIMY